MKDPKLLHDLSTYVKAAKLYGQAINRGNGKESDKHFDAVEAAFLQIKSCGEVGLKALAELLESRDEGERLWAAAHLLNYPGFRAREVLEDLKQSPTALALTAEVTLDEWKRGKLKY